METKFKKCASNVYANKIPHTSEELNERFDIKGGELFHKNYRSRVSNGRNFEGKPAGQTTAKEGRVQVKIDNVLYKRSRVIWKMMTGKDPIGVIDHINCKPSDDRFENLQDIPQGENMKRGRWKVE